MSLDYLEALEQAIDQGGDFFASPGNSSNQWSVSRNYNDLTKHAQRLANNRKFEVPIYQLTNRVDAVAGNSFLICKKILPPGTNGEPKLQWALVDTKEAAEMMRDVSEGPTPYFGAISVQVFKPEELEPK